MGKLKSEDLEINVNVNGNEARKKINDLGKAITDQTAQLKKMRSELKSIEKEQGRNSEAYKKQKSAVDALNASIDKNKADLKEAEKELKLTDMTLAELRKKLLQLKAALNTTDPKTDEWKTYNKQLKDVQDRIAELKNASSNTSWLKRFSKSASGFVFIVEKAFAIARKGLQFVSAGIGKIADFEQANVDLATILGKNVKEIRLLTDSALSLGRTTEYTASQVTSLQTELAKLGFDEGAISAMQEPVLHFATAIGTDLASAASLAGATLRIFGLQSKDTEDVLGTLAVSTNQSALSFSYLNEAMSIVGPVANAFGFSVKDTTALLGTLANAGFDASSAATATRNILLNLANANGKLAQALGKPVKTFPELIAGLKKLDASGIDLASTLELTDNRSVAAFNSFLTAADSAIELRASLEDVDGELERIAGERLDTVKGSVKLLQSAWEGFILSMSGSKGVIKNVLDFTTKAIDKITQLLFANARVQKASDEYFSELKDAYSSGGAEEAEKLFDALKKEREAEIDRANTWAQTSDSAFGSRKLIKTATEKMDGLIAAEERLKALIANEEIEEAAVAAGRGRGQAEGNGNGFTASSGSWSLSSDKTFIIAKAELDRKYRDGEIASQEEYDETLYQLEVASLNARLSLHIEKGEERAQIQSELYNKEITHRKTASAAQAALEADLAALNLELIDDATQKELDAEDRRYNEERKKHQAHAEWLELTERKHLNNVQKIRADAQLRTFSKMQSDHSLERAELANVWDEKLATVQKSSSDYVALSRQKAEALAAFDIEYLTRLRTLLENIVSAGTVEGVRLTDEQIAVFRTQLQNVISQITGVKSSLTDDNAVDGRQSALFGVSQDQWDQFFANLRTGKLTTDNISAALNGLGGAAQEGFQLVSLAMDKTAAKENAALKSYEKANDKKKSALEQRLKAGLITQDQYNSEVQRLEEEQQARQEQLSIRKAEREKKVSIAQAIINTALSVTKALASSGNIASAAVVGALGAVKVALIASTPVTGAEDGGPVMVQRKQDGKVFNAKLSPYKRGFISSPTVLVGEAGTEYVIPHTALENPSIAPFIGAIETARRSGNLKNLNLAAVYPRMAISGRASGGFLQEAAGAEAGTSNSGIISRSQERENRELLDLLRKMDKALSKPLQANVSMLGRHGIVEKTREYERQRKRGRLNG